MTQPLPISKGNELPLVYPQPLPQPNMGDRTVTHGCLGWCWDKICALFAYLRDLMCCKPTAVKPLPPVKPLSPIPPDQTDLYRNRSPEPISEPTPPSPPVKTDLSISIPPQQPPQFAPPYTYVAPSYNTPDIHPLRKKASDFIEENDIGEEGYEYNDLASSDGTDKFKLKSRLFKMFILSELTAPDRPFVPQELIKDYVEILLKDPFLNPQVKQPLKETMNDRAALHAVIERILPQAPPLGPLPQPLPSVQPITGSVCLDWANTIIEKYTANSDEYDYESLALDPLDAFRDYKQLKKVEFLLTLTSKDRSSHPNHDKVLSAFLMNFHPDKDIDAAACARCMQLQNEPLQLHTYLTSLLARIREGEKVINTIAEVEKATSGVEDADF